MQSTPSTSHGLTELLFGGGILLNVLLFILNWRNRKADRAKAGAETDQAEADAELTRVETAIKASDGLSRLQMKINRLDSALHTAQMSLLDVNRQCEAQDLEIKILTGQNHLMRGILDEKGIRYDPDAYRRRTTG